VNSADENKHMPVIAVRSNRNNHFALEMFEIVDEDFADSEVISGCSDLFSERRGAP
jgi:hypothetical protein